MISVAGVVWGLPVPTHAQDAAASVQIGQGQKAGTNTTESLKKTKEIGPGGNMVEKEERTSKNQNLHGDYKYSGIPCKWQRK